VRMLGPIHGHGVDFLRVDIVCDQRRVIGREAKPIPVCPSFEAGEPLELTLRNLHTIDGRVSSGGSGVEIDGCFAPGPHEVRNLGHGGKLHPRQGSTEKVMALIFVR